MIYLRIQRATNETCEQCDKRRVAEPNQIYINITYGDLVIADVRRRGQSPNVSRSN